MADEINTIITRKDVLYEAGRIVSSDRNISYGEPDRNFERIATMWSAYKGIVFEPHDVAVMQALVKMARITVSPNKADHWIDIAGYAALGGELRPEFKDEQST